MDNSMQAKAQREALLGAGEAKEMSLGGSVVAIAHYSHYSHYSPLWPLSYCAIRAPLGGELHQARFLSGVVEILDVVVEFFLGQP